MSRIPNGTCFRSKVGPGIVLATALPLVVVTGIMVYSRIWPVLALMVLLWLFVLHLFLSTDYTIAGGILHIRCGFFYRQQIAIQSIKSIAQTRLLLSGPALSGDRLEIRFGKGGSALVSPQRQETFVAALLQINPQIVFKKRKTRGEKGRFIA